MTLKPAEARTFYDRFGSKQDSQSFYEDPALSDLVAHASFCKAGHVLELGCGTGRFAARLLAEKLPADAVYLGCDVSRTMVDLATERLAGHADRARVVQTGGSLRFPVPDHSLDRVIATYVLDLMSEEDIREFFLEAHRVLDAGGKVCLVSLTNGVTLPSRIVIAVWTWIFRARASLVGGCRPISLEQYIDPGLWTREYRNVVVAFAVPSEVLVVRAR